MESNIKFHCPLESGFIHFLIFLHKIPEDITQTDFRKRFILTAFRQPELGQCFIKSKGTFIQRHQICQCVQELATVVVCFHHFFNIFQAKSICVRQHMRSHHFIRRCIVVNDFIFILFLVEHRTFQHLQETQLQLFRLQTIHIVEGFSERCIILMGQTCNKIQMLMNISPFFDLFYDTCQFIKIHISVDGMDGMGIGGLHTDFKLEQAFSYVFQKINGLLIDDICRDFKMEIGHTIIVFIEIFPDCHSMAFLTVKSSIDEFHLRYFCIQKFLQVRQNFFQRNKANTLLYRRQAVATLIRAATRTFIVNNLIFNITEIIFIGEWQ